MPGAVIGQRKPRWYPGKQQPRVRSRAGSGAVGLSSRTSGVAPGSAWVWGFHGGASPLVPPDLRALTGASQPEDIQSTRDKFPWQNRALSVPMIRLENPFLLAGNDGKDAFVLRIMRSYE